MLVLLVVALLVALVVPPIFTLFSSGYRTTLQGEALLQAGLASTDLLEQASAPELVWTHVGEEISVPGGESGLALMEPFSSRYGAHATVEVSRERGYTNPATGEEETELARVTVRLVWRESGRERTFETATLIANLEGVRGP